MHRSVLVSIAAICHRHLLFTKRWSHSPLLPCRRRCFKKPTAAVANLQNGVSPQTLAASRATTRLCLVTTANVRLAVRAAIWCAFGLIFLSEFLIADLVWSLATLPVCDVCSSRGFCLVFMSVSFKVECGFKEQGQAKQSHFYFDQHPVRHPVRQHRHEQRREPTTFQSLRPVAQQSTPRNAMVKKA